MPQVAAPYDRKAVETALQAWLEEATGVTVIIGGQDMPQPTHPYGELTLPASRSSGQDEQRTRVVDGAPTGQEIEISANALKYLTASVDFYSHTNDAGSDARTLIDQARAALGLPGFLANLRAAGIAFVRDLGGQSLDEINSNSFVQRMHMDFLFCVAGSVSERTGYIASILTKSPSPIGDGTLKAVLP